MLFRDFIDRDATIVPIQSGDRDGAIGEIVASLGRTGAIDAEHVGPIVEALLERERTGTTGFGLGVAVPHAKDPRIARQVGAVGVSAGGLDFAALDRKPVFTVIVLLTPKGQDALHVQAMEITFRNLNQEGFRRSMRQAATPAEVATIIDEADAAQQARLDAKAGAGNTGPPSAPASTTSDDGRARVF